ncbi:MAG: M23 family metallopeptidase [Casimicrobiaceae bacterium]
MAGCIAIAGTAAAVACLLSHSACASAETPSAAFRPANPSSVVAGESERGPVAGADARWLEQLNLIVPVAGVARPNLRDSFDAARGAKRHEALDIPAARGTAVLAAGAGRIAKLYVSRTGGLTIYQFDPERRFAFYYAHLDGYAPGVREGMSVERGQHIGFVGTTGNAPPDAPHLHFAILKLGPEKQWWRGTPVNPLPLLHDP